MSFRECKTTYGKTTWLRSTAIAVLLAAGATTANAEEVTATVEHECPLPLVGDQVLTSEITTELPATTMAGEETGPIQIDVVTTLPAQAQEGLILVGGETLEGSAEVMSTIELPNRDKALNATLAIPQQNIPFEGGPFSVNASGTVPSQSFTEDDVGQAQVIVGDLLLEQQVRDENGDLVADPVGEFASDCTIVSSDNVLHEFEVVPGWIGPMINVDPDQLDFGRTVSGDPVGSRTLSVTVSNTGTVGLGVNSVAIEGADADAYTQTNNCTTVAPNASCTVNVTYTPSGFETQSATLKIDSTDNSERAEEEGSVPLTGEPGTERIPDMTVDPESVNFGIVDLNTGPVSREVIVGNDGSASLNINSIEVRGDNAFIVQDTNCTIVAPDDDNCSIQVGFYPSEAGESFSGTLSIASNDANSPEEIPLSGDTRGLGPTPVGYNLDGQTTMQASDAAIALSGLITAVVDIATGDLTADLQLDSATAEFEIFRFFTTIEGRVDIEFEPLGETIGTLSGGTMSTESELNIKVPEARVVIFGKELKIGGGTECQTSEPVTIPLQSQDDFTPLEGGSVSGTYDLPPLENCGILTDFLNRFISGPDNTIDLDLTLKNQ